MLSLFGRFGSPVGDQLIDHTDPFGNKAPNELLDLGDGGIARTDSKLAIYHFHDNGIADLKPEFAPEAGRDDKFATIDDFGGT
ncbi:hypothetical protein GCM10008965_25890 [Methylorubrum aminovorans]|nr:hypothetical protein GCM10025880_63250 [Methylorubrum aminovorans]